MIFKRKRLVRVVSPSSVRLQKHLRLISLLGERDYQFVIELAADTWNLLEEDQKKALLDHQLCFIGGEEDEKSGEMKYTSQPLIFLTSQVKLIETGIGDWTSLRAMRKRSPMSLKTEP